MAFVQNFPFFTIIMTLFCGPISTVLSGKKAKIVNLGLITLVGLMNLAVFMFCFTHNTSYTYMMGHFPAPWGNEIRAGVLEALMALVFCVVMLLSLMGGLHKLDEEVEPTKENLYYILVDLLLGSLLALIYTNDIFTGFVFLEVSTLASCGCLVIKERGPVILPTIRYMIFNLVGSGLFLIGIVTLYDLTGYLSIENIATAIKAMPTLNMPTMLGMMLVVIGLSIKSPALFPIVFNGKLYTHLRTHYII